MKIQELKENEPLKVIEVSKHVMVPQLQLGDASNYDTIECKQIQMMVFTDGELAMEGEEVTEDISEYYIGKKKYQYTVDTLKTRDVFFRNHSYVITYLIAQRWMSVGNFTGWFDVVEDVSVYLENAKDKKALKDAKRVIGKIQNRNDNVDYSSFLSMYLSRGRGLKDVEIEEIAKNAYSLRKIR